MGAMTHLQMIKMRIYDDLPLFNGGLVGFNWNLWDSPSGNLTSLLKMAIYSEIFP